MDRDIRDASGADLSADWRFGISYNAALKLCTLLLYASGYKPSPGGLHHYRPLAALPFILGEHRKADAEYLEMCRRKRNVTEYDRAGTTTTAEAKELLEFAIALQADVRSWMKLHHPELI